MIPSPHFRTARPLPQTRRPFAGILLYAIVTVACGGGGDAAADVPDAPAAAPSPAPAPAAALAGSGAGIPIEGTERLAWIQDAPSLASAQALSFVVYIDGGRTPLPGVTCQMPGDQVDQIECQAKLPRLSPGVHTLELAAVNGSTEGEKSPPITVEVVGTGATLQPGTSAPVTSAAPRTPPSPVIVCADGAAATCFVQDTLAEGLSQAEGLTALPDGRALWIEEGRRLHLGQDGGTHVAFELGTGRDDTARIIGVAVDPSFTSTRLVYAATVSPTTADESRLAIVRLREVAGVFGEAAVLVPGVPVPSTESPALAIGADGMLYVAVPAGGGSRRHPDGGLVLRFDPSGDAVGASRFTTPTLSAGTDHPGVLAWGESRLWLTARDRRADEAFAIVPLTGLPDARPSAIVTPAGTPVGTGVSQLALVPGIYAPANTADAFFVTADPSQLFGATIAYGDTGMARIVGTYPVPLGNVVVRAIAVTPARDLLVLLSTPDAPATASLIRLRARAQ